MYIAENKLENRLLQKSSRLIVCLVLSSHYDMTKQLNFTTEKNNARTIHENLPMLFCSVKSQWKVLITELQNIFTKNRIFLTLQCASDMMKVICRCMQRKALHLLLCNGSTVISNWEFHSEIALINQHLFCTYYSLQMAEIYVIHSQKH